MNKLHRERSVERPVLKFAEGRCRCDEFAATGAEKTVGEEIRLVTRAAAVHHGLGQSAEIFHQHDAQRNGYSPQFTTCERL